MTGGGDRALTLARHYAEIGRWTEVLDVLGAAGDEATDFAEVWEMRAFALHCLNRNEEARESVLRGLEIEPDAPDLMHTLARIEEETGNLAAAERAILGALRQEPEDPGYLSTYAGVVARGGQFEKAERLLEEAARVAPHEPGVTYELAVLRRLQGRDREAEELARELLARAPDDPRGKWLMAIHAAQRGDLAKTRRHARDVARDHLDNPGVVDFTREVGFHLHPAMWPIYPFVRFGAIKSWIVAILVIRGLDAAGFRFAAGVLAWVFIVMVVYSWIAPPVLRRILVRR